LNFQALRRGADFAQKQGVQSHLEA
jgi:hypothetical protein